MPARVIQWDFDAWEDYLDCKKEDGKPPSFFYRLIPQSDRNAQLFVEQITSRLKSAA